MISFQSFFFYFHRQTSQYIAIVTTNGFKCCKIPNILSAAVNELSSAFCDFLADNIEKI